MTTSVAFLGGTGDQGRGLARRYALAGHPVLIGSRSAERAEAAASELLSSLPAGADVRGATNLDAARAADLVVVAVPWEGHGELVAALAPALAGKGLANPMGAVSSAGLMLEQLGWADSASRIEEAVRGAVRAGKTTPDVGGSAGTKEFTGAVIAAMG